MNANAGNIQKAAEHFSRGEFEAAHRLYLKAASQLGDGLVRANLLLCERRMQQRARPHEAIPQPHSKHSEKTDRSEVEQQLAETQRLLEHYFNRCQELEYQLTDIGTRNP